MIEAESLTDRAGQDKAAGASSPIDLVEGSGEEWALEVTDLKQYDYCPRLVYYRYCLPALAKETYSMEAGTLAHEKERQAEARRSLARYGLQEAERQFNVSLYAPQLGLVGRLDLVLLTGSGSERRAIPVDYKDSSKVQANWRMQLAAYALLLEAVWGLPVEQGFIYLIPLRKAEAVKIDRRKKEAVRCLVDEVLAMVNAERMPAPTAQRGHCVDCEYRRYCNDVF